MTNKEQSDWFNYLNSEEYQPFKNSKSQRELENELLEKLSDLEHEQWMNWSITLKNRLYDYLSDGLSLQEAINVLTDRWEPNWIPYSELDEKVKEFDREYAKKVLEILKDN